MVVIVVGGETTTGGEDEDEEEAADAMVGPTGTTAGPGPGRRGPMMREDGGPEANPPPILRMGAERPIPP
jgi:hypothetical protein